MTDDDMSQAVDLEATTGADIETSEHTLTVRRTFDAPLERVYRAFTDPKDLARWYAPGDMTAEVHALEPEAGGTLAVTMYAGDEQHAVEGTYIEVVEFERLVHTWEWQQGPFEGESRVTVTFDDADGGTEVTLTHERLEGPESVTEHAKGWSGILENLAGSL